MIGVAVVSDRGPDMYLPKCLAALDKIGLSADLVVDDVRHELGMAGAVRKCFEHAVESGWEYLFRVEEDFLILDAPLDQMKIVLDETEDLAQICLKRQPWAGLEVDLGDQLKAIEASAPHERRWWGTAHKNLFSMNPCLIPRRIFERGYPDGNEAEQSQILKDEGWWFGVWGTVEDPPRCTHIGTVRSMGWRL